MRAKCQSLAATLVLVTMGAGLCTADAGAGPREFRWRLRPGETLRFIDKSESTFRYRLGVDVTKQVTRTTELSGFVERTDADGSARVRQTFDRFIYKSSSPGSDVMYDSSGKTKNRGDFGRIAELLNLLVGARISFTLTPQGEIRDAALSKETEKAF